MERGWSGNQQDTVDLVGRRDRRATAHPGDRAVQRSATERHLTMQATVTWSYRTLGPRAARLLRWLAVFAGPVDLATVEWLLGDDPLTRSRCWWTSRWCWPSRAPSGQHLPDARPDPGVRGAAAGRGGRGAGRPGPARGLVGARVATGPPRARTAGR